MCGQKIEFTRGNTRLFVHSFTFSKTPSAIIISSLNHDWHPVFKYARKHLLIPTINPTLIPFFLSLPPHTTIKCVNTITSITRCTPLLNTKKPTHTLGNYPPFCIPKHSPPWHRTFSTAKLLLIHSLASLVDSAHCAAAAAAVSPASPQTVSVAATGNSAGGPCSRPGPPHPHPTQSTSAPGTW